MKKKFYGALLVGSLFLAGGMVSCSDYDDDINSLNERVDALEKTVADLKKAIEAGAVITNVQSTENGVTVTLSDGKTFEVKNGAKGEDGADGSVIEIKTVDGVDYWFLDGENTGYPVKGEKGDDGNDGQNGKDGCWYFPNEDGFWHKQYYNEKGEIVDEATTIAWVPSAEESVRVVYDTENGCLLISNAEGMEEGQVIAIPITSDLKSLAVIPYVWDKEMSLPVASFYNVMGYNTKVEVGNATAERVVASSTKAKAHFRLNPANADVKAWEWSMINRTVEVRAAGDASDLLSIDSYERSNDELIVSLKSNKSLEESLNPFVNERAIAALQGVNKETNEVITSDYMKVTCEDLTEFSIVNPTYLPVKTVEYAREIENLKKENDLQMVYTESIDLNEYVATWVEDINSNIKPITLLDEILDEGELTYEFKVPATYLGNDGITNQQDFIVVDNGVVTINKQKYPNGEAAIGRTPIVEVIAKVNDKFVAYAYVRLSIVREEQVEQKPLVVYVSEEPIQIEYSSIKAGVAVQGFTWERMNREVYDVLKLSRDEFIKKYIENGKMPIREYKDNNGKDVNGVTIMRDENMSGSTTTNIVELAFDEEEVPSSVTGTATITYIPENTFTDRPIQIVFKYVVSHNHVSYPDFNERFVKDGIATVKGQMDDNNVWTQKVEISEHFLLDSYKADGNHEDPILVIDEDKLPEGTELADLTLTTGTLATQTLTLNTPIEGNELNVPVNVVIALANGEQICVKSYTIRFVNPFQLKPIPVSLEAPFPGRTDSKPVGFTIVEREGGKLIAEKGKYTTYAKDTYGLTGDVTVTYSEGENNWAQYGLNNEADDYGSKQKLSLYEDTSDNSWNIKWENKGTALVRPVDTKYQVNVTVGIISIMSEEAAVTVTETDM